MIISFIVENINFIIYYYTIISENPVVHDIKSYRK